MILSTNILSLIYNNNKQSQSKNISDFINCMFLPYKHKRSQRMFLNKLNSSQNLSFHVQKNKQFTLNEISSQVVKNLKNKFQLSEQTISKFYSLLNLPDLLEYFKSYQKQAGFSKKDLMEQIQYTNNSNCNNCKLLQQKIKQLQNIVKNKNQLIVNLNNCYEQAKLIFQEETSKLLERIREYQKQMYQIKAINQIIKQKNQVLLNYRKQRQKSSINIKNTLTKQIPSNSDNSCHQYKNLSKSKVSQNSYDQLKDVFEAITLKMQTKSTESKTKPTELSNKYTNFHTSQFQQSKSQYNSHIVQRTINEKYAIINSNMRKNQMKNIEIQNLVYQINQLKQNQSKLLDRIFERDQIISKLLQFKNIHNNP